MAEKTTETKAVDIPGMRSPEFDADALAGITSFDDALALATETLGADNIVRADEEIGDGFILLEKKDSLIGVPLMFLGWDFHMGDFGEFVSAKVVTKDGRKIILNDGSSGLYKQLAEYSAKKKRMGGLLVPNGLRKSDYEYEDEKGEKRPATTYYIDTTPPSK
jgi:hypothetical protein